jgi:hypothetical protein
MKYLDTGRRDPAQALATWLTDSLTSDVVAFRFQTGYFSSNALGLAQPTLERLAASSLPAIVVIGANDGETIRDDVELLVRIMGVPRHGAHLGIVAFAGALFHPKTYHITRADGSQAAYVGSANFTRQGASLHVEAGISLDTRDGDDPTVLAQIADAIDSWHMTRPLGLTVIDSLKRVDDLVADGVLSIARPPRALTPPSVTGIAARGPGARLKPLFSMPTPSRLAASSAAATAAAAGVGPASGASVPSPAAGATAVGAAGGATPTFSPSTTPAPSPSPAAPSPLPGSSSLPAYFNIDPASAGATMGLGALSGSPIPGGAVGLIFRWNNDSARHFLGGKGTANISIPVELVPALKFGIVPSSQKPRADLPLRVRYLGSAGHMVLPEELRTNVMGYGFVAGESGHGDVRMLVPAGVKKFGNSVKTAGMPVPQPGNLAILEWPTATNPKFSLSLLEPSSAVYIAVETEFKYAVAAGQNLHVAASLLPSGLSPVW